MANISGDRTRGQIIVPNSRHVAVIHDVETDVRSIHVPLAAILSSEERPRYG